MNIHHIWSSVDSFEILHTTSLSQSAMIRLDRKEATSDKPETHPDSDQTILMLKGEIEAQVNGEKHVIRSGECLLIGRGIPHRLVNATGSEAVAFTVYAPPAYPV